MLPSGLVKRSVWEGTNATKVSLTLVITLKSHSHPRKAARNLHISTHSSTLSLPNKNRRNRHVLMVNLKAPISEFIIDATSNQISFSCVCAMAFIVFQLWVENIAIRLTFRCVWCPQTLCPLNNTLPTALHELCNLGTSQVTNVWPTLLSLLGNMICLLTITWIPSIWDLRQYHSKANNMYILY